ncbi:hypothetical protein EIP86_005072 [Pleurotus ostreatoroseus]|nr:hypothetical protein EIP86_005072 [Pleurotus ostreatoroseus]
MTGEDSYHAHCFNCKVCKKRIEELVFAKTSTGIYCMECHNARVARSRRHQERREREKRERERRAAEEAATANGSFVPDAGAVKSPEGPTRPLANGVRGRYLPYCQDASRSASVDALALPSDGMSKTMQKRKSFDDRPLNLILKEAEALAESTHTRSDSLLVPDGTSRKDKRRSINPAIAMTFNNMGQKPASQNSSSVPSPTSPNHSSPQTPSAQLRPRMNSPLRDQFPMEVTMSPPQMADRALNGSTLPSTLQLDGTDKHIAGRSRSASSSAYPDRSLATDSYERQRSRSPIRPNFTLDRLPTRTSSRQDHRNETAPPGFNPETGRHTPQFTTEGRASPSGAALNGGQAYIHKQRSFDDRHRYSTSSLNQSIELPPLKGSPRPTSPSHKVDVPHGIESGTDTEAEGEEEEFTTSNRHQDLPPLPPPKEGKGAKVGTRPPQLNLDTNHVEDGTDVSQFDGEDLSEDLSHEEPVESTSHSTFIAPALPPIRFSMSGADFSDLFNGVAGQSTKSLDQIIEGMERQLRVDVTPPPSSGSSSTQMATPTNGMSRRSESVDATPIARREPNGVLNHEADTLDLTPRREPILRSRTPSPSPRPLTEFQKQATDTSADALLARTNLSRPAAELVSERSRSYSETKDFRPSLDRIRRQRSDSNASIVPTGITVTTPENATSKVLRPDTSDLVRARLQEALSDVKERKSTHVKLDSEFIEAIIMLLDQHKEDYGDMKRRLDGMKRASQQYVDGLSVAQTEYDRELKARRDAEAEVTRLRVLLSGQAVRLTAVLGETKRQEAQKQLSEKLAESLSSLEKDLAKLQVERDMTLAEVEELSASKSSPTLPDDGDTASHISRALSVRFDSIKVQYQHELLPLTAQKESLIREIAELRAARDSFLEEATILNARNEELAQLSTQYVRRVDSGVELDRRGDSLDKARPPNLNASVTSSTLASSEESGDKFIKISKPELVDAPAPQANTRKVFKWPGSRPQPPKDVPVTNDVNKAKARVEHTFQQISMLRVSRCDHCGDKMWGSQLRCSASPCMFGVCIRCMLRVLSKRPKGGKKRLRLLLVSVIRNCERDTFTERWNLGPSLFGRDLTEQVKADSKDEPRSIPVIVEKCIGAVDALALDYEGIYRKTGGSGQSKMITQLFERGDYSFDLLDSDRFNDVCSITSVLKTYFRSLPDPLLTYALHDKFIAAATVKEPEVKGKMLTELVAELPKEHYETTRALMLHLHRICEQSEVNLMHARNLGVVFGPTLMRSRDPNAEFADMAGKALTIEWLVENAQALFGEPDAPQPEKEKEHSSP